MSNPLKAACQALIKGECVILTDDKREHEADLMFYGPLVTPELMNFMIRYTSGVVVIPMEPEDLARLELPQMVEVNTEQYRTAFTVSVDATEGTTSGVSAFDRCRTLEVLCDPHARPADLRRPGHLFPLEANPKGLRGRRGHTEASIDLLKIAGLRPIAAICELLSEDGRIMDRESALQFQREHGFPLIDVNDILEYVEKHDFSPILEMNGALV